ncbi:MAG: hypothetical protein P8Z81_14855 [Deinococcales bacterium]
MSATQAVSSLVAASTIITALAVLGTRYFRSQLWAYVWQSTILAAYTAVVAVLSGHTDLFWAAGVTLFVRAFLVPAILLRVARALPGRREEALIMSTASSLLIGVILVVLAALVVAGLATAAEYPALLAGLSVTLCGLFLTASRPEAFPQLLGLLQIENGLFLVTVGLTPGLPLINELVVLFDLVVLVVVIGVLIRLMTSRLATGNTAVFDRLRG